MTTLHVWLNELRCFFLVFLYAMGWDKPARGQIPSSSSPYGSSPYGIPYGTP